MQSEAYVPSKGPSFAKIMLVGEAPGKEEVDKLEPFVGPSGFLMTEMLQSAGILRSECFITNVCKYRPPSNKINQWFYPKSKHPSEAVFFGGKWVHKKIAEGILELENEIEKINPSVIIAFGNTPLFALTENWGITKWRGSGLQTREIRGKRYNVLPTYHPASILRNYAQKYIGVHDLRKARGISLNGLPVFKSDFIIRPSYERALLTIRELTKTASSLSSSKLRLAVDIETRFKHITCVGVAWSRTHAICIPFLEIKTEDKNYWKTLDEEVEIVLALRELLTHPNVLVVGQGFSYDQQYFARRLLFVPNYKPGNFHDTMTVHHILFAGLPKSLDFQSSFYLDDHVYWKDDGKEWNPKLHDEEQHWTYNCTDAVRTYAISEEQERIYKQLNFPSTPYGSPWTIQHECHEDVLRAMLRGINTDPRTKDDLARELGETITRLEDYISYILGHPLNPRSPKQLDTLFYTDFKIKPVLKYDKNTGTRRRTCDADALVTIGKRELLLAPLCASIADVRSLGTFKAFASKDLDTDGRTRCAYTVPGTETYRYASAEDAFGFGTNLQNVSLGHEKDKDGNFLPHDDPSYRPNLRKMFVPDVGFVVCDHDLEQADARIVAKEANCISLLEIFNDPGRDLHNENCAIIFGKCTGKDDPNRVKAKAGVHATNYGATARILAAALGITVHEAERFMARYFGERPEVEDWHERVRCQLQQRRYVENVFGYRRFYFDRIEETLKEALAWIAQSTVAITINLGIQRVRKELEWAEFLLQVHDSAVHQFPEELGQSGFDQIKETMAIALPYPEPLTIPVSGSWSKHSWGHCK